MRTTYVTTLSKQPAIERSIFFYNTNFYFESSRILEEEKRRDVK